jgi:hypothetical protein
VRWNGRSNQGWPEENGRGGTYPHRPFWVELFQTAKGLGISKSTAYLYHHTSMFLAGIQGRSWIPAKNMPE